MHKKHELSVLGAERSGKKGHWLLRAVVFALQEQQQQPPPDDLASARTSYIQWSKAGWQQKIWLQADCRGKAARHTST